ncbi:antibiotic biosynthesis monooxygenase [Shimwellia pseudoproteus]|uniref:putative quinol monooxygenase n=1 Tax=Shimwellia pseudoproteus TaxID=570012 RepID=UPI0018ED151C|nr:putative quinol monooxygenase [Shimwellia pseudoproteus]MBJ3816542.1 antibiotic biosynthesis monooxygenase [Shimwellia pseudoproteus]
MKPIHIVAHIVAKPDSVTVLGHALQACLVPSRNEPGCLAYHLHQDVENPAHFVFIEQWQDQQAIDEHREASHYKAMAAVVAAHALSRDVLVFDQLLDHIVSPATS